MGSKHDTIVLCCDPPPPPPPPSPSFFPAGFEQYCAGWAIDVFLDGLPPSCMFTPHTMYPSFVFCRSLSTCAMATAFSGTLLTSKRFGTQKPYHYSLQSGSLYQYRQDASLKGVISLHSAAIVLTSGTVFQISSPYLHRPFVLTAPSEADAQDWVSALQVTAAETRGLGTPQDPPVGTATGMYVPLLL